MLQFDDVLKHLLGEFGKYQLVVYILLGLTSVLISFHVISPVFILATTESWCKFPDAEELAEQVCIDNFTTKCEELVKNLTIPMEQTDVGCGLSYTFNQCYRYNITGDDIMYSLANGISPYENATMFECDHGWEYDRSQYKSTVAQQFDLVCDQKYLTSLSTSFFMLGMLVGSSVFGVFLDRFGRKRGFMLGMILMTIFGTLTAFSPNYIVFAVSRFCVGAAEICAYVASFVLATEFVGPSKRTAAGMAYMIFYALGYMLLSLQAYYIREWWILQLVMTLPSILVFSYWWIIPESPRWLISKGREQEAEKIIRKCGRINGRSIPDDIFGEKWNPNKTSELKTKDKDQKNKNRNELFDLFRLPNMRKKTLILVYCWVVITLVYYGLVFNTSNLGGSDYINCFVAGAVEIPAALLGLVIMDWRRLGRRWSMFYTMIVAGIACIGAAFVPPCGELAWLGITLASISKLSITCAFDMIYVYSAELFPTPVRSTGMGVCSTCARVGGILAPQLLLMADVWVKLPSLIFGVASILAGILILPLPETRGTYLPETMEEGEQFGKKPKKRKVKTREVDVPVGAI